MIVPEHHLANARSLRKICVYQTTDTAYILAQLADHNLHDSFDAYCVFQHSIIRSLRLHGIDLLECREMMFMAEIHFGRMDMEFFECEKKSLFLVTSIDLRNYGKSLCKPFLQE